MKRNSKKGFTIVELVIVIAVIAILAAVLIPTFTGLIQKAKDSAYLQNRTSKQTEGVIEKIDNPKYMTWEDFEDKFKKILDDAGSAPSGDAIKESVAEALEEAGFNKTNLNEDIIKQIVDKELEKSEKSLTDEEIQAIADAVIEQINQNATEESSTNSSTTESSAEESSEVSEESSEVSEESSEEISEDPEPVAYVESLDPNDARFVGIEIYGAGFSSPFMPDIAYAFYSYPAEIRGDDKYVEQEEYKNKFSKYLDWKADYEIESNRDVEPYSIYLAGSYATFGGRGILSDTVVQANTPIRLLKSALPDADIAYKDLFDFVTEFDCGIANLTDDNIGTVITVRLCLYPVENGEETGETLVVCEYPYTCGEPTEANANAYTALMQQLMGD